MVNCKDNLKPPYNELYQLYITEKRYALNIATMLGVSDRVVYKWLKEYGIRAEQRSGEWKKRKHS